MTSGLFDMEARFTLFASSARSAALTRLIAGLAPHSEFKLFSTIIGTRASLLSLDESERKLLASAEHRSRSIERGFHNLSLLPYFGRWINQNEVETETLNGNFAIDTFILQIVILD